MSNQIAETASALDSVVKLGKPIVETACRLLESLLGEPCKVAGGMLADQVYAWRWRNRIRILTRAKEIIDARDIALKAIPPSFLLPLIESAGDVEATELQNMWAQLLASGIADPDAQHPSFVKTLGQLSTLDALILTMLSRVFHLSRHPECPYPAPLRCKSPSPSPSLRSHLRSIENLMRLGLCDSTYIPDSSNPYAHGAIYFFHPEWDKRETREHPMTVRLTMFGEWFLSACVPPIDIVELVKKVGFEMAFGGEIQVL